MNTFDTSLLRRKITFYIVVAILTLVVITGITITSIQKYQEKEKEEIYRNKLHKSIEHVIDRYLKNYNLLSERLIKTTPLIQLLEQGDREGLYKLLKPKWDLRRKYRKDLNLMQIFNADGTAFLRIQEADKFGDYIFDIRPIVKEVNRTHKRITAYETCKDSTAYRIVTPIFNKKNEYIGVFEVGVNPNIILNAVDELNGCEGLIFIKEGELKDFNKSSKLIIDNYGLQSEITPKVKGIVEALKNLDTFKDGHKISTSDKTYIIHNFALKDFKNKEKVRLVFFQDISKTDILKEYAFISIIIIALILLFIAWLIYRFINVYETKVVHLYNEQKRLILSQSKHVAMGEMISMIAHQWRQPISVISMGANNIMFDLELEEINTNNLKKNTKDIIEQTKHLSQTIDDFRNFFKPNKQKDKVLVSDIFMEAYNITKNSFTSHNIKVENRFSDKTQVKVFSRELLQVFVNLLKNSQESLVEHRDNNRKITTIIYETKNNIVVEVCDNGLGIKDEIKDKIFEPYFSTKDEKNGTGLGLYMSQTIIKKHIEGSLYVRDYKDGACFIVEIPKKANDD